MTGNVWSKRPPGAPVEPTAVRHVIDEYRHKTRTVTCMCGWVGGSEGVLGGKSAWTEHVAEMRRVPPTT